MTQSIATNVSGSPLTELLTIKKEEKDLSDAPCCFSAVKLDLLCSKWRTTAHLAFNSKACQTWQAPDGRIGGKKKKTIMADACFPCADDMSA